MDSLNLSVYEIKELIALKEEYWENTFYTNCYAFALGLDVPENDIANNAYQLGIIGAIIYKIPMQQVLDMSYVERFLLDMRALKIRCVETSSDDQTDFKFIKRSIEKNWVIALFSDGKDFHFARKNYAGQWYHKMGYLADPTTYDSNNKRITDIESCSISNYEYVKSYRLQYKIKTNSLFSFS